MTYSPYGELRVSKMGYSKSGSKVVLYCGSSNTQVFTELEDLFHNMITYIKHFYNVKVQLHVVHPKSSDSLINNQIKSLRKYIQEENIFSLAIASEDMSTFMSGADVYKYINLLCQGNNDTKPHNKFDVPCVHTVPSKYWLQTGKNIKSEGSGVNLLGFVARAIKQAAINKRDGDIEYLTNQKKYPLKPKLITTIEQFDKFFKSYLLKAKYVGIDTETDNLNKIANTIFTAQFCVDFDDTKGPNLWVVPLEHPETPWDRKELNYIKSKLRRWLTGQIKSNNRFHIYHNAKFDLVQFMNQLKVEWFNTPIYDTGAGEFSLDENMKFLKTFMPYDENDDRVGPYSLEATENRYGYTRPTNLVISKTDRGRMREFSLKDIALYGSIDVLTVLHIFKQQVKIAKDRGYKGFSNIVANQIGVMLRVMSAMESRGILVDVDHLKQIASPVGPLADRINEIVQKFYGLKEVRKANKLLLKNRKNVSAGGGLFENKRDPFIFKINNDESLKTLFFDVLDLEPLRLTKTGEGSTDKKFQKKYKEVPAVKMFGDHSALMKLKSAFADSILETMNTSADALMDGCIRPSYWFQTVLTGRSASTGPNIQQIPSRGSDAKLIKSIFIAHKGQILIKSDFSAHEIRVLGNVAQDKMIIKAFKIANNAILELRLASKKDLEEAQERALRQGDIHIINVKFFFGKDITKDHPLRTDVKTTVFSVVYGSKAKSLGAMIGKSEEEAQALIDRLFEVWSTSKEWMDNIQSDGSVEMVVFSPINRPRHLFGYMHPDKWVGYAMDRRGPNSAIQGLASDIGYQASDCIQQEIFNTFTRHKLDFDGRLRIMVHDSMTNSVSFKFAPVMSYIIEHGMTTLVQNRMEEQFDFKIRVPFGFDMEMGISEGKMNKWDDKRYDTLTDVITKMAEDNKQYKNQLSDAMFNLDWIRKVREKELRDDPYKMTLQGRTDLYLKHMKGLE